MPDRLCPSPASPLRDLHLSSGPRALGQIPNTCALVITGLEQLPCQLLRGPARPAPAAGRDKGQRVLPSAGPARSCTFQRPRAGQGRVGTRYPDRDRHREHLSCKSSLLCAVTISFALEATGTKREILLTSQDFIFGGFFVRAFLCLSEVLLCSCKTEIQRIIKTTRKLNHRNVRKQYRAQREKQIVFHTHKFPLGLTASQEYFQGIGRKKLN